MRPSALLEFLRRELSPTPGRAGATFRLTLAAIATTIPLLTHHVPEGMVALIVLYLVTREDTAATLIGSVFAWAGVTIGLGLGLLACKISLDLPWLRFCLVGLFLFGGLFLNAAIAIPGLGTAIGLPAALSLVIPDIIPPDPDQLVYFILWLWCCITIGLSVNAGVQLLLYPGDPLALLQNALDMRLLAVEQALRRLAGAAALEPPPVSLNTLGIAGMSRPLALLKSASMIHRWARERHERLTAIITLVDRLVTSAIALEEVASLPEGEIHRERLLKVADACDRTRRAFAELRLPSPSDWVVLATHPAAAALSPLADMERTLDEITLAVPGSFKDSGESGAESTEKLRLLLPDAFTNPEHVHFAIKGALAAFICYVIFVGFDYPGIYTSVITCFVVSLSTIGASNQKGILRFGGAAVGGGMALFSLIYLFPNMETIGGFWLIFGAGTAVAAWATFGTPRIFYGGYQTGLAFYKAVLQGFGQVTTLTVIRDRLIGIFLGLIVFGIVEQVLWPVRAQDALRARLAELIHLLAELARTGTSRATPTVVSNDVDAWRRRISQKVQNVQELIESSKFELRSLKVSEIQKLTGEAQIIFILLLSLARQRREVTAPNVVRAAAVELDDAMAAALQALSTRVASDSTPAVPNLQGLMDSLERHVAVCTNAPGETATYTQLAECSGLYRALVAAILRLSSESLNAGQEGLEVRVLAVQE
ncbi:MAG: FUSC family protein [Desulfobaccales bacterium]